MTTEDGPVTIDDRVQFGRPAVRGVATQVLADRYRAGESVSFLADDYGLLTKEVLAALEFEGVPLQPGCKVETGKDG